MGAGFSNWHLVDGIYEEESKVSGSAGVAIIKGVHATTPQRWRGRRWGSDGENHTPTLPEWSEGKADGEEEEEKEVVGKGRRGEVDGEEEREEADVC
uniref:Uncharacterized protein n=1 Tax=Oryza sativa subsp. japonica TaxID=39947 RepID=Q6YYD1_ORYSJ|nr:hypothetical protein [Oryza sativa Japonica Group]BAD16297.1 hypothetical protein [Oryza sativa Japonica Group]